MYASKGSPFFWPQKRRIWLNSEFSPTWAQKWPTCQGYFVGFTEKVISWSIVYTVARYQRMRLETYIPLSLPHGKMFSFCTQSCKGSVWLLDWSKGRSNPSHLINRGSWSHFSKHPTRAWWCLPFHLLYGLDFWVKPQSSSSLPQVLLLSTMTSLSLSSYQDVMVLKRRKAWIHMGSLNIHSSLQQKQPVWSGSWTRLYIRRVYPVGSMCHRSLIYKMYMKDFPPSRQPLVTL